MNDIRKALTFRASSIGDCLMGTYLLEQVHAQYPQARLGLVVGSRSAMIRDLLAAYPWIEVLEANRRSPETLGRLWSGYAHSDLCVTQYAGKAGGRFSLATKFFARALTVPGGLVGFEDASSTNRWLYDRLVRGVIGKAPAQLEREALQTAGIEPLPSIPMLRFISTEGLLQRFNLESRTYVVVHLFAGNTGRGMSLEKKREVLVSLTRTLPGIRLIVTGGVQDRAEALSAAAGLSATVIAGEVTLQEMMQLMSEARGVVSVDTGVAHMAAQLQLPLVVMATCLGLHWWGAEQYPPKAVQLFTMPHKGAHVYKEYPECLGDISADAVAQAALAFLK